MIWVLLYKGGWAAGTNQGHSAVMKGGVSVQNQVSLQLCPLERTPFLTTMLSDTGAIGKHSQSTAWVPINSRSIPFCRLGAGGFSHACEASLLPGLTLLQRMLRQDGGEPSLRDLLSKDSDLVLDAALFAFQRLLWDALHCEEFPSCFFFS